MFRFPLFGLQVQEETRTKHEGPPLPIYYYIMMICSERKGAFKICLTILLSLNAALLMFSLSPRLSTPTTSWSSCLTAVSSGNDPSTSHNSTNNNTYLIYGHIHVAKTAGTSLNILMAATFSRVCGHKGYSFDFFQHDKRIPVDPQTNQSLQKNVRDSVLTVYEQKRPNKTGSNYFRGRVYYPIMDERGYEECDWISNEAPWQFWEKFSDPAVWPIPLELHVPCREPIEHFMSQCNFRNIKFDCQTMNLTKAIEECLVFLNRYDNKLLNLSNIDVKCFNNDVTFTKYIEYMQPPRMQHRKIPVKNPKPYSTNKLRNKDNECIWKNETVQTQVIAYLRENYDYYSFCEKCLGSQRDLFGQK